MIAARKGVEAVVFAQVCAEGDADGELDSEIEEITLDEEPKLRLENKLEREPPPTPTLALVESVKKLVTVTRGVVVV